MDGTPAVSTSFRMGAPAWEMLTERPSEAPKFNQDPTWGSEELRDKFNDFVAGSFFKSMLESMRKTVGKSQLIHGGRAEEIFRAQLDNTLVERMANQSGGGFSEKLFEQFVLLQQGAQPLEQAPSDGSKDTFRGKPPADAGELADHTF